MALTLRAHFSYEPRSFGLRAGFRAALPGSSARNVQVQDGILTKRGMLPWQISTGTQNGTFCDVGRISVPLPCVTNFVS